MILNKPFIYLSIHPSIRPSLRPSVPRPSIHPSIYHLLIDFQQLFSQDALWKRDFFFRAAHEVQNSSKSRSSLWGEFIHQADKLHHHISQFVAQEHLLTFQSNQWTGCLSEALSDEPTTLVKTLGTPTHQLVKFRHLPFPLPAGAVLTLCIQVLVQHNQHCLGERGAAEKG